MKNKSSNLAQFAQLLQANLNITNSGSHLSSYSLERPLNETKATNKQSVVDLFSGMADVFTELSETSYKESNNMDNIFYISLRSIFDVPLSDSVCLKFFNISYKIALLYTHRRPENVQSFV